MVAVVMFNDIEKTIYRNTNFHGSKEELIKKACWRCIRTPSQIQYIQLK